MATSSCPSSPSTVRGGPVREAVCPSLPPELWIRCLSYHDDLTHLWLTCRAVSSTFQAYAEQVFAEYVVRDTHIDWALEKHNLGGMSKRPEVCCEFARFSKGAGKEIAYFRETKKSVEGGSKGELRRKDWRRRLKIPEKSVMERWEERVKCSRPDMPSYTIRIGDMVNDTTLPGLSFDAEEREIGVEWRGMFRAFFREQDRFAVLKKRWQDHVASTIQKMNRGEAVPAEDISWSTHELQIRKRIRRARLQAWYEEQGNEEMIWAVTSLRHYERCKKEDGSIVKTLGVIPGAALGERWFGSTFWIQGLHMDEADCLHRINVKVEHSKVTESGSKVKDEGVRGLPQQRARSMSVASTITVS